MGCKSRRTQRMFSALAGLVAMVRTSELPAQNLPAQSSPAQTVLLLDAKGKVDVLQAGRRLLARINQPLLGGDRVQTWTNSRANLLWYDHMPFQLSELSEVTIPPPPGAGQRGALEVLKGFLYFFHRGKPQQLEIRSPTAAAIILGTEFSVQVAANGQTVLLLFDGDVQIDTPFGGAAVKSGEQALINPGQPPVVTPILQGINDLIQWFLYYPGVLNADEAGLTPPEEQALAASLAAYRSGDLREAIAAYPAGRQPGSDAEKIYVAALLLSVGQVERAEGLLATLTPAAESPAALAASIRKVIAAVKGWSAPSPGGAMHAPKSTAPETGRAPLAPQLSTARLAESYHWQSRADLTNALRAAQSAVRLGPRFGFAWARLAEMQFSFGQTRQALAAVERALELSPRNAQALTLKGFLLSAQNKVFQAQELFERALALDGGLGNAWLGRGLCRIRRGDAKAGREDLLVAAAVEPQRSLLRSYLAKALSDAGERLRALHELDLAKRLDANDPTPWLYSALENWEENRVNEAVRDLERSIELNDNRALFRSRLLLDEDRAVRSASLAKIYESAGLGDVSLREAARAVSYDYANHSAHQFLAESYNTLRDPTRFNLRYETVWFNELLLANILAPVGAGLLSQQISQQEYASLFERSRLGLLTTTEYRSDGQYRELASQLGVSGNTAWALDLDYQHNNGIRPNNELDRIEWYTTIKQQLTSEDSMLFLTKYQSYHSGDNRQLYTPRSIARDFTFDEDQQPLLYGAYHHEWDPGIHTLLLAGRLINDQRVSNRHVDLLLYTTNGAGQICTTDFNGNACVNTMVGFTNLTYRSQFETFPVELDQIVQRENQILNFGGRLLFGRFATRNVVADANIDPSLAGLFHTPPADDEFNEEFRRTSLYIYYTRELWRDFLLTAGVAYDDMKYPANYRFAPITRGTTHRSQWLPKVALNWTPWQDIQVRGIYSQAAGGVSFDESFRLEPTQLAGFSQAFRSLISESEVGSVAGAQYEILGAALDLKLKPRTYLSFTGRLLRQNVDQEIGVFYFSGNDTPGLPPQVVPGPLPERLRYEEIESAATFNQLIGDEWSVGAQYRFTDSTLRTSYPTVPAGLPTPRSDPRERADLHQFELFALFRHPSGFFARAESRWYLQHNTGYATARPGDDFVQFNVFAGYRFPRLRGEVTLGVLNLSGRDYQLNSLNPYNELPHERVFLARLRLNF